VDDQQGNCRAAVESEPEMSDVSQKCEAATNHERFNILIHIRIALLGLSIAETALLVSYCRAIYGGNSRIPETTLTVVPTPIYSLRVDAATNIQYIPSQHHSSPPRHFRALCTVLHNCWPVIFRLCRPKILISRRTLKNIANDNVSMQQHHIREPEQPISHDSHQVTPQFADTLHRIIDLEQARSQLDQAGGLRGGGLSYSEVIDSHSLDITPFLRTRHLYISTIH
jgi:hypothetical protein